MCGSPGRFAPVLALAVLAACASGQPVSSKIAFDLARVDAAGLIGDSGAKRALHYEFCIPADEQYAAEVRRIDATAQLMPSRGRVGCSGGQVLVLGSTYQPGYREVLERLAALPYVDRIAQSFFE